MIQAVEDNAPAVGTSAVCVALGVSRATVYRHREAVSACDASTQEPPCRVHPRALGAEKEREVLEVLNSERFVDKAPAQVYADLIDDGAYYCSERTMYRILHKHKQVQERRNQRKHPVYAKPELIATAPNQVWSWDITKLRGPRTWSYYHLYVIIDIYSRFVVGWMLAKAENGENAKVLVTQCAQRQHIDQEQLILHSDRGAPMKSKTLGQTLIDLGIAKSHSRPHTSDDNPFSEAQFKTLKYRPEFPNRFSSQEHAHRFCQDFFAWYNAEHHHSGIAALTPQQVHYGETTTILEARQKTLLEAYKKNPERFVHGPSQVPQLPQAVYINPPTEDEVPRPQAPQQKIA